MSIPVSSLTTAGLLASFLALGALPSAHAGDGCSKDKKDQSTSSLWTREAGQTAVIPTAHP